MFCLFFLIGVRFIEGFPSLEPGKKDAKGLNIISMYL